MGGRCLRNGRDMRQLSSAWTPWYTKVFPIFFFGFAVIWSLGVTLAAVSGEIPLNEIPIFILGMIVMGGFGYAFMRFIVWPIVDKVVLDSDEIVVRNRGQEARFSVSNILNVDSSSRMNPERITLTLREPCVFGKEVVFIPTFRFFPFARHPIAAELIAMANSE